MVSPQAQGFASLIRNALPGRQSVAAASQHVRDSLPNFAWPEEMESAFAEAVLLVEAEYRQIEVLKRRHSIVAKRPDWYAGKKPGDIHWPALETYLREQKRWDEDTIGSVDETSTEIVSLLDNPERSTFGCRGLVVGYVQSGKTANMTAVIAKAVDAGYNVIFVLAGLTDKLRQQTQRRLESDIVFLNPTRWHRLTTGDIKGDFQKPAHGGLMFHESRAQLAVIKKNVGPLKKFLETVKDTPAPEIRRLRVLIIDDECDQASVNSASGETDMTKINEKIREILAALPAVSYVGYTATPFANVLINPYADQSQKFDDLYPKDFITALPTPKGYFGAERLFGALPTDADAPDIDNEGLDMIRTVSTDDENLIQPASRDEREDFVPDMADSLRDAILYFLATCAARRVRGQTDQHMTMLVHTSPYISMHTRLASLIDTWIGKHSKEIEKGSGEASERMRTLWETEQRKVSSDLAGARQISFAELHPHLAAVLEALEVPVENGASDDRIDYSGDSKTYIVIGGTVLARGLTLEGLAVSYFLRNSNQYDTLLQMGRWFGYRPGYEDLPRIWMPASLQLNFQALSRIEAEIRQDISEYRQEPNVTPMEFAVRVRTIPGMAVTARNKMRHARPCDISYWGRHVQTIRFDRNKEKVLEANWQAAGDLVAIAQKQGLRASRKDRILFEGVPRRTIIQFLRNYTVQESHRDLRNDMLLSFIERGDARLNEWNIGVAQVSENPVSEHRLGPLESVRLFSRTRLPTPEDVADIKALMSKRDVLFDCPADEIANLAQATWLDLKQYREKVLGPKPLLLLYPIDRLSEPAPKYTTTRKPLDAQHDVMAFGMLIPGSTDFSGTSVSVDLAPISADELDRIEAEELESAERAGVT